MAMSPTSERVKKVALYVALTYAATWALVRGYVAVGGRWNTGPAVLVGVVMMFIPLAGALCVKRVFGEPAWPALGISLRGGWWYLGAWLAPVCLALAALAISLGLPGVSYSPEMEGLYQRLALIFSEERVEQMRQAAAAMPVHIFWLMLVQALVAGPTINALAALGEETGWRGFLYAELRPLGFWPCSVIIGALWGLWHAPVVLLGHNYPEHPLAGVPLMTLWTILMTPLLIYLRERAQSVLPCAVFHGTVNSSTGLALALVKGGNDLLIGVTGAAGMLALAAANVALVARVRGGGKAPAGEEAGR